MDNDRLDDEVLSRLEIGRRELVRRLIVGTAFAVPVVASFDMAALTTSSAEALSPNQVGVLTANQTLGPPQFTSGTTAAFQVGQPGSFLVTAGGGPAARIATAGPLPAGVTLLDNQDGSATLSGTPAAQTGGTYSFTVTAANGNSPNATQTFVLTVLEPPAFVSAAAATFNAGAPGSVLLVATGFPVPTIAKPSGLPGGVTFTAGNGDGTAIIAGTPRAGAQGTSRLTLTASNGINPASTQSFTLTIRLSGPAPSNHFTIQNVHLGRGGTLSFKVKVPGRGVLDVVITAAGHGRLAHKRTAARSAGALGVGVGLPKRHPSQVTLAVTFTPDGGSPRTITVRGVRV